MPLFGKKKEQPSSGKPAYPQAAHPQQGAYPAQQSAYPGQQSAYPGQQSAYPEPSAPPASAAPPNYAPPPYTPQYQYQPAPQSVAPGYQPYSQPPNAYGNQGMPRFAPGTTVVGHGQFDAGARFGAGAGMNIPPPPPGFAPTAAQIAAAHGGQVHMGQAKAGFFSTSSDGGVATHFD